MFEITEHIIACQKVFLYLDHFVSPPLLSVLQNIKIFFSERLFSFLICYFAPRHLRVKSSALNEFWFWLRLSCAKSLWPIENLQSNFARKFI